MSNRFTRAVNAFVKTLLFDDIDQSTIQNPNKNTNLNKEFQSANQYHPTPSNKEINKEKGYLFERYIISLFEGNNRPNKKYFEVADWTRDIDKKTTGVLVKSNQNPDLTFCYNNKNYFAIECKFRTDFTYSFEHECKVLKWSYPSQIKRYQDFQKERNIPVFIVIGVGGEPNNPQKMYCLPLNEAKYPELFPSYLQRYERNPKKLFFWKNNKLF